MHKGRDGRQITSAGVYVERNDKRCVVYRGTRAALIEAGLTGPEHFPEGHRRLTWHFPKSGANWSIRRKAGEIYSLTKLKDRRGVVDAELDAFNRAAVAEARRDPAFQRFMEGMRHSRERAGQSAASDMRGQRSALPGADGPTARHASGASPRAATPGGLEAIAVATFLVGFTIYLWTRQA